MTTDDFTAAAIRKADEWFPGHPGDSIGEKTTGWAEDTVLMVAEWARAYLSSQEPTDAEVEAVAESYEPGLFSLSDHEYEIKFDNPVKYRSTHQGLSIADARDALVAARAVRQEEER